MEQIKSNGKKIITFDSTLRDGSQAEGISFSVQDKLRIVKALDELGIDIIEAGNPSSNPKDIEFFAEVKRTELKHSRLAAFGATRKPGIKPEEDKNLLSLVNAGTAVAAVFGKTWDLHVTGILKTTLEENLAMIEDTVRFLKNNGKEVHFDAEHFFDGYKNNREYAVKALKAAEAGGADYIALCDTNGGTFPDEVYDIITELKEEIATPLGIHTHNDSGMAVANTVMAVKAGVSEVQGTLIGFGERCGNANLSTIIGDLQLKKGYQLIPAENLKEITSICLRIAEISNKKLNNDMPYVGKSAFTHKAGMHIDGVNKISKSFEHVSPLEVGNNRRFLMSEVAGRSTLLEKIKKIDASVKKDDPVMFEIMEDIKRLEYEGYQFEGAEASLELLIRKHIGSYKSFFELEKFKTIGEQNLGDGYLPATAMVKVRVNEKTEISAAEGAGPVDALDKALKLSLEKFYPQLKETHLIDFKVRILDSKDATTAATRVLVESADGIDIWSTVGVSRDVIKASLIAITDSLDYKLMKDYIKNK